MVQNVTGTLNLSLPENIFLTETKKLYLQCKTGIGAVNVNLPSILNSAGVPNTWGFEIYVNDVDNNASTNNITITPNGTDKINGVNAAVVINTNGGNGAFEVVGTDAWEFFNSASASVNNSYKRYVFLATQNLRVTPPSIVTLENNLSGTPVWSYIGVGINRATLAGAFHLGHTWSVAGTIINGGFIFVQANVSVNYFDVYSYANDGTLTDGILDSTSIEVRVY